MAEGFTRSKASTILQAYIKSTTFVALSTTTPDENGGNFSEPSTANGYSRRAFGTVDTSISAQVANKGIIFICELLADCGSATHLGLSDSETVGTTPFLVAKLTNAITLGEGYVPLIRAHKLIVGLDKEALESYA